MVGQLNVLLLFFQKPANILVMGEGPERGRVKIGKYFEENFTAQLRSVSIALLLKNKYSILSIFMLSSSAHVCRGLQLCYAKAFWLSK